MTRGKGFIFSIFFALIISFFLVILGKSEVNSSPTSTYSPRISSGSPLMILLDNSGSMGKCSQKDAQGKCFEEIPNRIDIVKEAIRERINQSDMASTKIGLVEFGNYKSYGTKERSCEAVKTLTNLEINNNRKINEGLGQIQANDDGPTPISYAIKSVVADLESQHLLPARILVITDGEPNCKPETKEPWFCGIIGTFANNQPPVEIKVDIIGYKATGKDGEFLECAKKYPDFFYYWGSANSPPELARKLKDAIPVPNPSTTPPSTPTTGTSPSISPTFPPPLPNPSTTSPSTTTTVTSPSIPPDCKLKTFIAIPLFLISFVIFITLFIRGQVKIVATVAAVVAALAAIVQALPC
ncbi:MULTISPECIES: vWA domain-containing protein [Cyanophyceae]|uniref:vWA domain-containing protein n=1 Tax=Cyanophyceae TaxID=3028117 RepID=UPI0016820B2C|nr:vWA domain-containing protein [Trichocoleus sp. FACHB-69]MBD1934864.1 VWA domain-containing protein [Trichocoleus sp. FACHB-69]